MPNDAVAQSKIASHVVAVSICICVLVAVAVRCDQPQGQEIALLSLSSVHVGATVYQFTNVQTYIRTYRQVYQCIGEPMHKRTTVPRLGYIGVPVRGVCRCTCVPMCRCIGVLVYQCAGASMYQCAGVPVYQFIDKPACQFICVPLLRGGAGVGCHRFIRWCDRWLPTTAASHRCKTELVQDAAAALRLYRCRIKWLLPITVIRCRPCPTETCTLRTGRLEGNAAAGRLC